MNMSFPVGCHSSEVKYFNVAIVESRCHLQQQRNIDTNIDVDPELM